LGRAREVDSEKISAILLFAEDYRAIKSGYGPLQLCRVSRGDFSRKLAAAGLAHRQPNENVPVLSRDWAVTGRY
jgi:hypothetical protein